MLCNVKKMLRKTKYKQTLLKYGISNRVDNMHEELHHLFRMLHFWSAGKGQGLPAAAQAWRSEYILCCVRLAYTVQILHSE